MGHRPTYHSLSLSHRLICTLPFINVIALWPNGHNPSQVPSAFLIIAWVGVGVGGGGGGGSCGFSSSVVFAQ